MGGVGGRSVWSGRIWGVNGKWIFLTKNPFFLGVGFFYKLTRNPNLTFFCGGGGGREGWVKGAGRVSVCA